MGAQGEPLLDLPLHDITANTEAPNLTARLEALQELLDAARNDSHSATAPKAESIGDAAHAPMPRFLQDQDDEEAGIDLSDARNSRQSWRDRMKFSSGHDRPQWMFLIATVVGSASLLAGLEYFDTARPLSQRPATIIADVEPTPPEVRLNFIREIECDRPPCDALSTAFSRTIATMPVAPAESASPGIVYATNHNVVVNGHTGVDPLDKVTVTGLPPNVRLSVGQKTSDTEWTLAAGDLSNIGIVVPSDQVEPIRATIEIKKAAGESVASLGLTIEREAPADPVASDPLMSMAPVDPVSVANEDDAEIETPKPIETEATPVSAPVKPQKPVKAKVRQKKSKPPQPQVIQAAETPKPPATLLEGLLQLPSPATKQATAPSSAPAPKAAYTDDSDSQPAFPQPPTTLANEPAGFEILRGLGGGFGLAPQ